MTRPVHATAFEWREAQHPPLRSAALMLAVAQHVLGICRASSPARIADEPGVTDPEREYADWLARMLRFEAFARHGARKSVAETVEWHRQHGAPSGPLADVAAFAIRRARSAIVLMLGDDQDAAAHARDDVLNAWDVDDELTRAAAGFRDTGSPRC